jgi:hypothetical protein
MITCKLDRDEVTPHLRRLLKQADSNGPLAKVLGRAGANELKKHFRSRNKTPNKLGGTRTNFWSRVAESVQSPRALPGRIVISITHPAISLKVHGGTVTPKKWKNLAIPIHPSVHGIKAQTIFNLLQFAMTRAGVKLLGLKENGGFKALYVLKKSVHQDKDPDALPKDAAMGAALEKAGDIHLRGV